MWIRTTYRHKIRERSISGEVATKEIPSMADMVGQDMEISSLCRQIDSEENKVTPLYQRVLAALIVEDQTDEIESVGERNMSFLFGRDDSLDVEHKSLIGADFDSQSLSILQASTTWASDVFPCNGNGTFTSCSNIPDQELDDHLGSLRTETEMLPALSKNDSGGQFKKMSLEDKILLELQSVGLYPEAVVSFQFEFYR